ncbi:MAG: DNA repair protein RecN [Candidatus Cloacimonetes bacterium]|nr:DNA repair protein RecN [Candidatus Cloacimonadota bacterium]
MIKLLKLENFIIVKKLEVKFGQGLQILTGETGTGKSIIVGAIDTVFAGNVKPGMLLDENITARLELTFSLDKENKSLQQLIENHEIETDDGEITFTREISTGLKSRSYINGRRVSLQIISIFREMLIDFHSQRDQQKLFDNAYQLAVVDAYAGIGKQVEEFSIKFNITESKIRELDKLKQREKELSEKIKLYEYQLQEITDLHLKPKEDEELLAELNLLSHAEEIVYLAGSMEQSIYEQENSVYDEINNYVSRLLKFAEDADCIGNAVTSLKDALINLQEAVNEIGKIKDMINLDQDRKDIIESRLDQLNVLKSKYRMDLSAILIYQQEIASEIASYSSGQEKVTELQKEIDTEVKELFRQATEISKLRQQSSRVLEKEIRENLKSLAIPEAEVEFAFSKTAVNSQANPLSGLVITGQDEVNILFSANKGIKIQPLKFSASGGEMSRFLLTLKKILTGKLEKRTIIFDEIDTGIGGRTAGLLGEFISSISRYHQVICITHLAQIAAFSEQHFLIEKYSDKSLPAITVTELNKEQKRTEIARMLAGSKSELALHYADEIIKGQGKNSD